MTPEELMQALCEHLGGLLPQDVLPAIVRLEEELEVALAMLEEQDLQIWGDHAVYDSERDAMGHDFMAAPEEIEFRRCTCKSDHWHIRGCWCGPRSWHKPEVKEPLPKMEPFDLIDLAKKDC